MKLKDLPIRKKIIFTNFMMIVIPVLIVLLMIGGIIIGFFMKEGSGAAIAVLDTMSDTVTNYQLQMMVDYINEDIVENENAFEQGSILNEMSKQFEEMGASVMITDETGVRYISPDISEDTVEAQMDSLGVQDSPVFLRTEEGFAYKAIVQTEEDTFIMNVAAPELAYPIGGDYHTLEAIKLQIKIILVVICAAAVIIIIITGIVLSKNLSRTILTPVQKLGKATAAIRSGDLDHSVGYSSADELGQVCVEFDKMRERLKESVSMETRYVQQKQEMIAGISHDLSTPITSIKGYVSGILDGIADTPEKRKRYLCTIYDTACDMEHMVDNLFLLSKLDMDKTPFYSELVEMGSYLADYCSELRPMMQKNDITLAFENRCTSLAWAKIDRMQLGRVFGNLADNSIKYKKADECVKSRVNIVLCQENGLIKIMWIDNGIGIREEEAKQIFGRFYRGDSARSNATKGSGLGLSIARRIMGHMGGNISAEGRQGLGVAITVTLPEREEKSEKNPDC